MHPGNGLDNEELISFCPAGKWIPVSWSPSPYPSHYTDSGILVPKYWI